MGRARETLDALTQAVLKGDIDTLETLFADGAQMETPDQGHTHRRSAGRGVHGPLSDEGEIDRSPFEWMRPPAIPEQPVHVLTEDELDRWLATCNGQSFENRRDNALVRLLADAGVTSLGDHGPEAYFPLKGDTAMPAPFAP